MNRREVHGFVHFALLRTAVPEADPDDRVGAETTIGESHADRVGDDVRLRPLLSQNAPLGRPPVSVWLPPTSTRVSRAAKVVRHDLARLESPGQTGSQIAIMRGEKVLLHVTGQASGRADGLVACRGDHEVTFALAAQGPHHVVDAPCWMRSAAP